MPRISVGGLHLHYQDYDAADPALPPVVLCAGVGYSGWFWHRLAPLLQPRRVLCFDNRGSGDSDRPGGPYSVAALCADVIGLLDALQVEQADVVGHSLGGFVAQELAAQHPRRVRRLALLGTSSGGPAARPPSADALAVLLDRSGDPEALFLRGMSVSTAPGFAQRQPALLDALRRYRAGEPVPPASYQAQVAAGAAFAGQPQEEVAARLRRIQAPTLVLAGEHDQVTPPDNASLLAAQLRRATLRLLPGVGHLFPLEDPAATAAALSAFFMAPDGEPAGPMSVDAQHPAPAPNRSPRQHVEAAPSKPQGVS